MSSISIPKTFTELATHLINSVREKSGDTTIQTYAKRYVSIALQDMHVGFDQKVPWAERDDVLITHPIYETGTVTLAQGGTAVTGTGTAWNTNNAFGQKNARRGGKIVFQGSNDPYRVSAVGGDTSLTLESIYIGEELTDATYRYFEDEYDLNAAFLRPVIHTNFDTNREIAIYDRTEFKRMFPRRHIPGKPRACCIIDSEFNGNTTMVRRILFDRPALDVYNIPYSFITKFLVVATDGTEKEEFTADSDEPIVWPRYRHAITYHGLYHWYKDKKDDDRRQDAKSDYTDLMIRIANDIDPGAKRARLAPHASYYSRRARRPYSGGGSRRFDSGGFDEGR